MKSQSPVPLGYLVEQLSLPHASLVFLTHWLFALWYPGTHSNEHIPFVQKLVAFWTSHRVRSGPHAEMESGSHELLKRWNPS